LRVQIFLPTLSFAGHALLVLDSGEPPGIATGIAHPAAAWPPEFPRLCNVHVGWETIMAGWFELSRSKDGQYRFVLKAANAQTILTSELYTTKAAAQNGITSVQNNSGADERYEKKTAANGKTFFTLKAGNHQVIGVSQMYASESSRDNGIASVQTNGSSTTVKDLTAAEE